MIALALEFSSDLRSVAVGRDGQLLAEVSHRGTVRTPVFGLIGDALARAGVAREAVGRLVVGIGPGSYTGVRLAISTAQGWTLATGAACVSVNSLENLARSVGEPVLLAVDAQRGELATARAADGRLLEPVQLRSREELLARMQAGETVAGPDLERVLAGAVPLFPRAATALDLARSTPDVPAELLAPVYLREAAFKKAGPMRDLGFGGPG